MRDPHVKAIYYVITTGEGISYRDPEDLEFANHLGEFSTLDGWLKIIPAEHFANEADVREAIEPFLKAWEMDADLKRNIGMLRFRFDNINLVDRNPPPPDSPQVVQASCLVQASSVATVSLHISCSKYPEPPTAFSATPAVMHAYRRWLGFRNGKEPLQAMSYFVLTIAEGSTSGRRNAASSYQIDFEILRKIGELSSTRGDEATARKADAQNQYQALSSSERQWLEAAVRLLIRRLGEYASGKVSGRIAFADLPAL